MIDQSRIGNGMTCQTACFFNAFFIASGAKKITDKDYADMNRIYNDIFSSGGLEKIATVRKHLDRSITLFSKKMRIETAKFATKEEISEWKKNKNEFIAIGLQRRTKLGNEPLKENHAVLIIDSDEKSLTVRNSWKGYKDIKIPREDFISMRIIERLLFTVHVLKGRDNLSPHNKPTDNLSVG